MTKSIHLYLFVQNVQRKKIKNFGKHDLFLKLGKFKTFDSVMTIKCQSCGAEVIINTEEATRARCHWCRNALSINEKIPNGAVPDFILPFKITKEQARDSINGFVGKRD